jgi:hypothetical protein
MAERILTLPAHLFRRMGPPAAIVALGALLMAAISFVLQHTRRPALPRMSEDWLRSYDREAGRSDEWQGFSW